MMRQSTILSMVLLMLTACNSRNQSSESQNETDAPALPVSEKQLCLDWYTAFGNLLPDLEQDEIAKPHQYIVADIDKDGLAEVLIQGEDSNKAAMLSYDKEGKVKFEDITNDGYLCLGIGDGWYVREFDDHMNEFRTFTRYYHKVENGEFAFIGHKATGFDGLDDEGEYIMKEEDATMGMAPADSLITMYYNMTEWKTISDDAKAAALTALAEGEGMTEDEICGDGEVDVPDSQFFAGEVKLEDGTRLRIDYMLSEGNYIAGYNTYYRSNGKTSKIPFFGALYYDKFVDQHVVNVAEYYNGKCCGNMLWSLNKNNELQMGCWSLRDKTINFESYETKTPDADAEFTSPALDFKVANALLPCDRETLKALFAKTYPESGPANYFMLLDIDHNGTFEVLVLNGFGSAPKTAVVWTEGSETKVMGFGKGHSVSINSAAMYIKSDEGKELYRWIEGKPRLATDTSMEEMEFFEENSFAPADWGQWLSL